MVSGSQQRCRILDVADGRNMSDPGQDRNMGRRTGPVRNDSRHIGEIDLQRVEEKEFLSDQNVPGGRAVSWFEVPSLRF